MLYLNLNYRNNPIRYLVIIIYLCLEASCKLSSHRQKATLLLSYLWPADISDASPCALTGVPQPVTSIHPFQRPHKYRWKDVGRQNLPFGVVLVIIKRYLYEFMRRKQLPQEANYLNRYCRLCWLLTIWVPSYISECVLNIYILLLTITSQSPLLTHLCRAYNGRRITVRINHSEYRHRVLSMVLFCNSLINHCTYSALRCQAIAHRNSQAKLIFLK